jgi:hypothetical protein
MFKTMLILDSSPAVHMKGTTGYHQQCEITQTVRATGLVLWHSDRVRSKENYLCVDSLVPGKECTMRVLKRVWRGVECMYYYGLLSIVQIALLITATPTWMLEQSNPSTKIISEALLLFWTWETLMGRRRGLCEHILKLPQQIG